MVGRRAARMGGALFALMLLLSGCSPANQGAVTLDEESDLPKLVLNFCEGEGVTAVRLTEARFEDEFAYEEGRTLWRIESTAPRPVPSVVAGEVPDGFEQVVPMPAQLPEALVMTAETKGGWARAAEQGGGAFLLSELEPGVLLQEGTRRSAEGLRDDTKAVCSSSFFGQLGLPTWLDGVALGFLGVAVIGVIGLLAGAWLRYRRNRNTATVSPPGWHPDPSRRFDHRYWDGSQWTQHVSRGGTKDVDSLP